MMSASKEKGEDDGRDSKRQKVSYRYQISTPETTHQFVDTWFPITIFVVNESGQLTGGGSDRSVEIVLGAMHCVENDEEKDRYMPEWFQVDVPNPSAIKMLNGRVTVRVKILECSMNDSTRKFFIEARNPTCGTVDIAPARTNQIIVINHQLQLNDNIDWVDEWYKDEGGREKCITFGVDLRNSKGTLVERKVPLKIRLVYANGNEVERQDILKLMEECHTTCSKGHAQIKARIDEVSRSHQNQSFQIRVEPDTTANPLNNDINSVLSPPVVVRSKRNNRKKPTNTYSMTNAQLPPLSTTALDAPYQLAHHNPMTTSTSGSSSSLMDSDDEAAATLMAVSQSFTPRGTTPLVGSSQQLEMRNGVTNRVANHSEVSGALAVENVNEWAKAVIKTIESFRWGEEYPRLPDGSLDTQRPRYSMRNPNRDIDVLLTSFKSHVEGSLEALVQQLKTENGHRSAAVTL